MSQKLLLFTMGILLLGNCLYADSFSDPRHASLETNAPFVLYLQNPPWIKAMRYVESAYHEAGPTPDNIKFKGWVNVTNRIAIQPSGMFFEPLTLNPIPGLPKASSKQRVVEGRSDKLIWQGNLDSSLLSLSSLRPEEGWAKNNHLQMLADVRAQTDIDPVRFLGFPALKPGSFNLTKTNTFEALTSEGNTLKGEILNVDNRRPAKLKYTTGEDSNHYFAVTYVYEADEELPRYFERSEFHGNQKQGLDLTNRIEKVEYGLDPNIKDGFKPEMFFDRSQFKTTLINSNGQRYRLTSAGSLTHVDQFYRSRPLDVQTKSKLLPTLIIFVVINIIFGLFLWRAQIKKRSES